MPTNVATAPSRDAATAAAADVTSSGADVTVMRRPSGAIPSVYPPEMVQRSVPAPKLRRLADRPFDVGACPAHGLLDRLSEREGGGDRRGKRAPRPVHVTARQSRSAHVELGVG